MFFAGFPLPLAAALETRPDFAEALGFILAGFAVVLTTLMVLALVCAGVGFLFRRFPALAGKPQAAAPRRRPALAPEAMDQALVAAIGAAVDQALGGRYRIKSIAPVGTNRGRAS